jgi:hypothetical protein
MVFNLTRTQVFFVIVFIYNVSPHTIIKTFWTSSIKGHYQSPFLPAWLLHIIRMAMTHDTSRWEICNCFKYSLRRDRERVWGVGSNGVQYPD